MNVDDFAAEKPAVALRRFLPVADLRITAALVMLSLGGCASMKAAPPSVPAPPQAADPTVLAPPPLSAPAPRAVAPPQAAASAQVPGSDSASTTSVAEPVAKAATPATNPGAARPAKPKLSAGTNSAKKTPVVSAETAAGPTDPAANPRVAAASTTPSAPPPLDLASLEQRLRETRAIGVFTKLSLKNQVDDLLNAFRALYKSANKHPTPALRQQYDLLLMKVLSLLQNSDPPLAEAISSSKEAIWNILADPDRFAKI
jgi:hypothetical protein